MHIYVVYQDGGDEPGIWDRAHKSFADALHAVEQYLAKLNEKHGYRDEIEKETGREGSENSGVGIAVAHIGEGKFGHIHIRKVTIA
jgi:hypothetical protein